MCPVIKRENRAGSTIVLMLPFDGSLNGADAKVENMRQFFNVLFFLIEQSDDFTVSLFLEKFSFASRLIEDTFRKRAVQARICHYAAFVPLVTLLGE